MYEDNKNKINIISVVLKVIIALLLVILSIKLVSVIVENRENKAIETKIQENLKELDKVAKKYIEKIEVPTVSGDNVVFTLKQLVDEKVIDEIKDENNKSCDMEKSFIQIIKLDHELQVRSYLSCDSVNDYIDSFISLDKEESKEEKTTKKTTKKTTTTVKTTAKVIPVTTTKKVTTPTKKPTTTTKKVTTTRRSTTTTKVVTTTSFKYTISFNSNGGSEVSIIKAVPGAQVRLPIPTREGYTFVGWYYNNQPVSNTIKVDSDKVLKAVWIKK